MSKKKTTKKAESSAKPARKRGTKTAGEAGGAKATKPKVQAATTPEAVEATEAVQDATGATVGNAGAKDAAQAKVAKKNATRANGGGKRAKRSDATKRGGTGAGGKPKRMGALDAAAQVLQASGQPMRSRELIAAMAEQGLWTSPAGATPHATLYAAMLREINERGREARFTKIERGLFAFNAEGK